MGFLITEILGLLALAAIAGGAFVYWWLGRDSIDGLSEYWSLHRQLNHQLERRLSDEREWRGSIEAKLDGLGGVVREIQPADLEPLLSRLASLEGAVSKLDHTDVSGVETKVAGVAAALSALGLADLGSVEERLNGIEVRLSEVRPTDFSFLERRVAAVQERVGTLRNVDLSPMEDRIGALAQALDRLETRIEPALASDIFAVAPPPEKASPGANLLGAASYGTPDDLKRIRGVGPKLERMLNEIGVFYFWQVSEWRKADVAFVDDKLKVFKGRIQRDDWVGQARSLGRVTDERLPQGPAA